MLFPQLSTSALKEVLKAPSMKQGTRASPLGFKNGGLAARGGGALPLLPMQNRILNLNNSI